jgi:hypothetical protein
MRKYIKSINEKFMMAEPATKPKTPTAPPSAPPREKPWSPVPTKRPSEREKTKPMGEYKKMMDSFFDELAAVKDTPEGREMIKNLYDKYAK